MWISVIFFTLFSVTGYYIIQDSFTVSNVDLQQANADHLANDMAIYRQAVITSASANPTATGKLATLAFPLGYADKGLWDHMIEANGNIWIFQKEKNSIENLADLGNSILRLSKFSLLSGVQVIVTKTECDNEFPFPEAVPEQGVTVDKSLEQASPINNLSTHSALKRETAKQQTEGFVICTGTVKKVDYPYFHAKIDNDSSKDIALPNNAGIPSGSVLWLAFRN